MEAELCAVVSGGQPKRELHRETPHCNDRINVIVSLCPVRGCICSPKTHGNVQESFRCSCAMLIHIQSMDKLLSTEPVPTLPSRYDADCIERNWGCIGFKKYKRLYNLSGFNRIIIRQATYWLTGAVYHCVCSPISLGLLF